MIAQLILLTLDSSLKDHFRRLISDIVFLKNLSFMMFYSWTIGCWKWSIFILFRRIGKNSIWFCKSFQQFFSKLLLSSAWTFLNIHWFNTNDAEDGLFLALIPTKINPVYKNFISKIVDDRRSILLCSNYNWNNTESDLKNHWSKERGKEDRNPRSCLFTLVDVAGILSILPWAISFILFS